MLLEYYYDVGSDCSSVLALLAHRHQRRQSDTGSWAGRREAEHLGAWIGANHDRTLGGHGWHHEHAGHGQLGPGGEIGAKLGLTMILGWAEWSAGARSRKAEEQRAFLGTNDYMYNLSQEERSWSLDLGKIWYLGAHCGHCRQPEPGGEYHEDEKLQLGPNMIQP